MDSFKSRSMRLAILAGLAGLTLAAFGCEKQTGPSAWKAQDEANAARPSGAKAIAVIKPKLEGILIAQVNRECRLEHLARNLPSGLLVRVRIAVIDQQAIQKLE